MNNRNSLSISKLLAVAAGLLAVLGPIAADTLGLKIGTKSGSPLEERKKQQIERLAKQYDLGKWTITRDIVIEQGVRPHSLPVLTLNGRFLDNDDRALSVYVHEQGHWLLMERYRARMNALQGDLERAVPGLPTDFPRGAGDERGTYDHLAVIMLEWQAMEELVGPDRARRVMDFQKTDHYTAIYSAVLERRAALEDILRRYAIKW